MIWWMLCCVYLTLSCPGHPFDTLVAASCSPSICETPTSPELSPGVPDLPLDIALPMVLILLVYFMAGLRYTAGAFFGNLATVYLVMLVAQSYGLLLGTLLMNPKTAQTIAAVFMLVYVLVAGFFVRGALPWGCRASVVALNPCNPATCSAAAALQLNFHLQLRMCHSSC